MFDNNYYKKIYSKDNSQSLVSQNEMSSSHAWQSQNKMVCTRDFLTRVVFKQRLQPFHRRKRNWLFKFRYHLNVHITLSLFGIKRICKTLPHILVLTNRVITYLTKRTQYLIKRANNIDTPDNTPSFSNSSYVYLWSWAKTPFNIWQGITNMFTLLH